MRLAMMKTKASKAQEEPPENIRTGLSSSAIQHAILDNLNLIQGRVPVTATPYDWYMAVAYAVRDRILEPWMKTIEAYIAGDRKAVCYLSAEFLMGPQLLSNMINLDIVAEVRAALHGLGQDLDLLIDQEPEPGLGNGGLGRLAACFVDSMASLEILATGYGIRYEFGIFKQSISKGWQVESADYWVHFGNPWEIVHPEITFNVHFGGVVEQGVWKPARTICGVACDVPVSGYKVNTVNLLRLWKAEAAEAFNFQAFNSGSYWSAVEEKVSSENITKVLYPNDEGVEGKRLRLEQQYFFVSCTLQDMIRVHHMRKRSLHDFHTHYAIQLNDTHPSIAIAELMRLFVDEHKMDWDSAWDITQKAFAYTNHTLLPEALEKWPLPLFKSLLPRHLEIIFEINQRFLDQIRLSGKFDQDLLTRVSIIDEHGEKFVCMAHLACIGSHAVNGVAELHSELLKKDVMRDFYLLNPEKFYNITNGVTPRRWLLLSNPRLADLITKSIGDRWICHMEEEIGKIEPFAEDPNFRNEWEQIKKNNKQNLTALILKTTGVVVDPNSLFDMQVKRIHEYKRQHLNVLHIIARYLKIKKNPSLDFIPRTFIFGGKAAPGYFLAKLIIKLINSVAQIVNHDPDIAGRIKVVFLPNFSVKNGHLLYPAADLSEQISTVGKEASGTGNMKFAMNGALTIGTLDGANVEIRSAVGEENFFLFGLTIDELQRLNAQGYNPQSYVENNPELSEVIDLIHNGYFSPDEPLLFRSITHALLFHDPYKLMVDFASYVACQWHVDEVYSNRENWTRQSILNLARIGRFSSDRSICEYASKIWGIDRPSA